MAIVPFSQMEKPQQRDCSWLTVPQISPAQPSAFLSELKGHTQSALRAERLRRPEPHISGPQILITTCVLGCLHLRPIFEPRLGLSLCQAPQIQSRDFRFSFFPDTFFLCDFRDNHLTSLGLDCLLVLYPISLACPGLDASSLQSPTPGAQTPCCSLSPVLSG